MSEPRHQKSTPGSAGNAQASSAAIGESHIALARKYRPKVFAELIGQDAMVRTLRNAFASGRIAQAYMLTGVRGVGKTTTARLIARALNYEAPGVSGPTLDMDGEGAHCRAILESRHLDVVEMDAASHTGIDDIRDLIDSAHYKPNTARYKVYILDEVHMLSKPAFAGLLKTLEEPPEHVKFIFATTEVRKVPVTVLSRCQRFDLKRIESDELIEHLKRVTAQEGATAEEGALALIARAAEGSVRDALSILDRAIAFGAGKVETESVRGLLGLADRGRIFDLLETVLKGDAGAALGQLAELNRDGAEPGQVIADLADAVHAVTLVKAAGEGSADPAISEAERARAADLAKRLSMPALARAWQMLLKGHEEVRSSPRPLAAADMVLVRLAYAAELPPPAELARQLRDGGGRSEKAPSPPSPPPKPARKPAPSEAKAAPAISSPAPSPAGRQAEESENSAPPEAAPSLELRSFDDVVALAEAKRDLKLKHALLEQVRLVHFKPGNIELNPLPQAAKNLTQELMRKLKSWTGRVWIVAVSDEPGAEPLGQQRREKEAREIETIREHPKVKEVLQHFPDARIAAVRPAATPQDADGPGEETDDVREDGTSR
ncbi:DNA polymerase III subunit gamma/tau [Methyloceanibacter sp.]|uniref:DNA polymerase III subunit gamma/tau n=1 Tax=Methyloceanibacter sp. TaxID=1965321 RepID=UPI002D28EB4E|nr:DNA polymerase III subunit gamma/tau [Methyloceanibacter sp.]HZP07888.1 DNA polymerase III subunit gamma/tau [Methyloceanibacter sp.]